MSLQNPLIAVLRSGYSMVLLQSLIIQTGFTFRHIGESGSALRSPGGLTCLTDMLAVGRVTSQGAWACRTGIASPMIESNHAYFSRRPLLSKELRADLADAGGLNSHRNRWLSAVSIFVVPMPNEYTPDFQWAEVAEPTAILMDNGT